AEERSMLMSLPFRLIPARHRLGLIDDDIRDKLLKARHLFAEELPPALRPAVAFFDADEYNAAASVLDNILFGRLVYGRRQAEKAVGDAIEDVVNSQGLRRALLELGLESQVGIGGGRLTTGQRQQLAIARGLLKRPDILVLDGATAAMAPSSQKFIMEGVFKEMKGGGLIWVLNQTDQARLFDHAVVMESGKVLEQGPVADLGKPGGWLESATAAE
ncbi:MAG: ABC transporter ATP-binding protein, partial [Alphaproteobacteria bacterium]|nr:ABC transporter ATP-binding protein [Alphaproteobacteria bacterium]